jgi:hypothetical protein
MLFFHKSSSTESLQNVKSRKDNKSLKRSSSLALKSLAILLNLSICTSAYAKTEQAKKSDSFVDSIGVNVHLFYTNTAYKNFSSIIKPKLQELGIRHIRDNGISDPTYYSRLRELRQIGIKTTLVSGYPGVSPIQFQKIVKDLGNVVEAVEGPNEYDYFQGVEQNNPNWHLNLQKYVKELYPLIKNDPATKNVPVIGPSLLWWNNYKTVGDLSSYLDFGNSHVYYGGLHPLFQCSWCSPPQSYLDIFLSKAKYISGNKPIIVTETGQQNAMNSNESYNLPVPEEVSGKYLPRQLLLQFNKNVRQTFLYELIDLLTDPQKSSLNNNYGLLRNDGSHKPAFIAIRDIIKLLQDQKTSFVPRSLNYELKGDVSNLQYTLLQKSNGKFYLILWNEVSSYDYSAKKTIDRPNQVVNLVLSTPISQVVTYSLNPSLKKISESYNKTVSLEVSDYPLIVELTPGANVQYKKKHLKNKKNIPHNRINPLRPKQKQRIR